MCSASNQANTCRVVSGVHREGSFRDRDDRVHKLLLPFQSKSTTECRATSGPSPHQANHPLSRLGKDHIHTRRQEQEDKRNRRRQWKPKPGGARSEALIWVALLAPPCGVVPASAWRMRARRKTAAIPAASRKLPTRAARRPAEVSWNPGYLPRMYRVTEKPGGPHPSLHFRSISRRWGASTGDEDGGGRQPKRPGRQSQQNGQNTRNSYLFLKKELFWPDVSDPPPLDHPLPPENSG